MSRLYTQDHEWIDVAGGEATVGITDYAQGQLGDVVFVDLPDAGRAVTKGGEAAVVESVKAASDLYAPVAGTVVATNSGLDSAPESLNTAPYDGAWMLKLKLANPADVATLLDPDAYQKLLG